MGSRKRRASPPSPCPIAFSESLLYARRNYNIFSFQAMSGKFSRGGLLPLLRPPIKCHPPALTPDTVDCQVFRPSFWPGRCSSLIFLNSGVSVAIPFNHPCVRGDLRLLSNMHFFRVYQFSPWTPRHFYLITKSPLGEGWLLAGLDLSFPSFFFFSPGN